MNASVSSRLGRVIGRAGGRGAVAAVVAISALLALLPAGAAAKSFSGRCTFTGTATLNPQPALLPVLSSRLNFVSDGKCTGKLNGRSVTKGPMKMSVTGRTGPVSCLEGVGTSLKAVVRIRRRPGATATSFAGTFQFLEILTAAPFQIRTDRAGLANGTARAVERALTNFVLECGNAGLQEIHYNGSFRTVRPLH